MRVRSDVKDIKLGGGNRQQDRVTIDERPSGKAKERAGSSDGFLLERVFRKSSYCWPSVKKEKRRRKNGGGTRSGSPSRPITVTHTQCIQESVGPCLHNPASVTTVYAGGARSSSSRSRRLSLSLCRPFLCNATIAQCPRALQSRSSGSDRQTYPRLFLSPFPEVFSLPDFRDRDRQRREREHASEDETGICPRDACGIDRADRMDQGWKRVFEFEMEGYVLSFLLSVEFTLRSIAAKLISDRSSLGKENFFFVGIVKKSNR